MFLVISDLPVGFGFMEKPGYDETLTKQNSIYVKEPPVAPNSKT